MATKKQEAVKPAGKVNETKAAPPKSEAAAKSTQPKEVQPELPTPAPKAAAKKKSLEPIVAEPTNSEKNKTMKKTQTDSIPDIVEQPMVKEKASKKAPVVAEPILEEVPEVKPKASKSKKAETPAPIEEVIEEPAPAPVAKEKASKKVSAKEQTANVTPIEEIPVIEEVAPVIPAPVAAPKTKTRKEPAAPVKKILSESSLDKRVLAAKAAANTLPRPTATPAARPIEKRPQVIIAHRKLENKAKQSLENEAATAYQPEVYRSILDEPAPQPITVYRYSDEELQEFKELIQSRLEAARKELAYLQGVITRKDEAGTEDTENRYMNMEDGSGAMEREQLAQLAGRQIQFVNHLEKALIRIENKTYGICRVTGKLIEKARLRAVPHATLSIEAKKMMNTKQN